MTRTSVVVTTYILLSLGALLSSSSMMIGTVRNLALPRILHFRGPVAAGYGRGSKKLGFPTANLPYFDSEIASHELSTGVYGGYCTVGCQNGADNTINSSQIYKCVTNIGLSPTFVGQENAVRIVETYVLPDDEKDSLPTDFYGEALDLALCLYIRPEKKFPNPHELITQIRRDIAMVSDELADLESSSSELPVVSKKILMSKMSRSSGDNSSAGKIIPTFEMVDYSLPV